MISAGARATGAAQTLIHIVGTAWASEARKARAGKRAHTVLTGATIEARVGVTIIDVLIAGRASITPMTGTAKTSCQVGAGTMGAAG